MKDVLLDYLKNYNIYVCRLLLSGEKNRTLGIIEPKGKNQYSLPLVYTIQKDELETDFYLFCLDGNLYQDKIQNLISELKILIQENTNKKIEKSPYGKDWNYWQDEEIKISFGIRSEHTGFSMRLSFPNSELILHPDLEHNVS